MTIWILSVLLLASLAGMEFRQGAIRVGFSLVGIIVGAIVAVPLGHLVAKLLGVFTLKHPVWLWALGPFIGFIYSCFIYKNVALARRSMCGLDYKFDA